MLKHPEIVEVMPEGSLEILSQHEVNRLLSTTEDGQYEILRRCALAVLNVGERTDSEREVLETFADFEIGIVQQDRGIKLSLTNAPAAAFVDGKMIRGIRELLFAVLRDVVFVAGEVEAGGFFDLGSSAGITNAVFHILRNASVLSTPGEPDMVVCWGGHSIGRSEYEYTKEVGYHIGLRELNICTGCGPGAMKGPMKGAMVGHAKQRFARGRYLGLTERGIIAAESPNPIVNQLVIMPDIEKRLEAFIRIGHAIVIFPGGAGTAEELLFLLGIKMHPRNADVPLPVVLTGPQESADYFSQIDEFIGATLGPDAQRHYEIRIADPAGVAKLVKRGIRDVRDFRHDQQDAYYYNWRLHIGEDFQHPFVANHENMAALDLSSGMDAYHMAVNLRRAFSGVVAGNVKEQGIRAIDEHGPFEIRGDKVIMARLDALLASFVDQKRMRLPGVAYNPCYRVVF